LCAFMVFTMFTNRSFLLCVKVFCNINYFSLICRSDLYQSSSSFFPLYIQPVYINFWIVYIFSIFLVSLPIFFISIIHQFIMPKLYLSTCNASAPIAVILFLPFSSDLIIILNLLLYSCFNLSFIC